MVAILRAATSRVSLAEVHRGGPFSSFPGIDRHMAVISGRLELSISGRDVVSLSSDTAPLCFPGEVAVYAEPHAEPATDLNVMTRRGVGGETHDVATGDRKFQPS